MKRQSIAAQALTALCVVMAPLLTAAQGVTPRSLYDGAMVQFEQAEFLKPQETTNHPHAYRLAPLILQEVKAGNGAGMPSKVFFQTGSIALDGVVHEQMSYWWFYATTNRASPPPQTLGLRLTMNTNGVPVIYEVLSGQGTIQQVFVTQSIEAGASAEFGPTLPGRRHAVEQSLEQAPQVVVSRVLDDPPDVMGPILYLNAESHFVATLICRCMDSQAKELVGQGLYELVPAGFSGDDSPATRLDAANPRGLPKDFINASNRLSQSLRLPRDF